MMVYLQGTYLTSIRMPPMMAQVIRSSITLHPDFTRVFVCAVVQDFLQRLQHTDAKALKPYLKVNQHAGVCGV